MIYFTYLIIDITYLLIDTQKREFILLLPGKTGIYITWWIVAKESHSSRQPPILCHYNTNKWQPPNKHHNRCSEEEIPTDIHLRQRPTGTRTTTDSIDDKQWLSAEWYSKLNTKLFETHVNEFHGHSILSRWCSVDCYWIHWYGDHKIPQKRKHKIHRTVYELSNFPEAKLAIVGILPRSEPSKSKQADTINQIIKYKLPSNVKYLPPPESLCWSINVKN